MSVSDRKKHMVAVRKIQEEKNINDSCQWQNRDPIQFATKRREKNGKFTIFQFSATLDHCYHRKIYVFISALFTLCAFE